MINPNLLIVASGWMALVLIWSIWRFRTPAGESVPTWLKWVMTANLLLSLWGGAQLAKAFTAGMQGGLAQLAAMAVYMGGFLAIFLLWHRSILGFFASSVTNAIDGGSQPVVPKPFYSRANALRKQAEFEPAVTEIESQLARFPTDAEGWLLKASILAENLKQPQLALIALDEFLVVADASDRPTAYLQQADVQLNHLHQPEAARVTLQKISLEYPDTEVARLAQQRIAHLPTEAWMKGNPLGERELLTVVQHEVQIGLTLDHGASLLPSDRTPDDLREELTLMLVQNPSDNESRERLARLYAGELQRPDLAHTELEHLISSPGQRDREILRWLNLIADIHLRQPDGLTDARLALNRIVERFPGSAGAHVAAQRLSLLKLEVARGAEEPTLHLGPPTGNLGLATDRRFSATHTNLPGLLRDPETPEPDESK